MLSKLVPAWRVGCLDADYNKYICPKCGFEVRLADIPKGNFILNEDILNCGVCSSKSKQPTPTLSEEELVARKAEIKKRLNK